MLNDSIKDLNSSGYGELITIQKVPFIFGQFWWFRVFFYNDWTVCLLFPLIGSLLALQAV